MSFKFACEGLASYFNGVHAVLSEGWIDVTNEGLASSGLNASNTVFMKNRLAIPIEGEPCRLALDIARIAGILPDSGTANVSYDGNVVTFKVGKSSYKITPFGPGAVREIKEPNIKLLYTIHGVSSKDIYDALKNITTYNKDVPGNYKCMVEFEDGTLYIKDNTNSVSTEITYTEDNGVPPISICLSVDLLTDIVSYTKKYVGNIDVSFVNDESPIGLTVGNTIFYAIAPRVDVD